MIQVVECSLRDKDLTGNVMDVRSSEQSEALRHVSLAELAALEPSGLSSVEPRNIETTAVIGGGTMGAGIVAALLAAGFPVTLIERDAAALDRGLAAVRTIIDAGVKRNRITAEAAVERLAHVTGSVDFQAAAQADLVIEAVFEDIDVKREVFAKLSETCRAGAILATNTSYLDPSRIADTIETPERFIGLHFFSPAHVMKLLEIVPVPETAQSVIASAFALAKRLGKIPVRAGICDGFIGNRILRTTREQAERLLLSGATPSDVDAAMRAFGLPMGPFEAQDLGGLDIAAYQRKGARQRGEAPFAPVADELSMLGRHGQKTAGGWYDYAPGERTPKPSPRVSEVIEKHRSALGLLQRQWTQSDMTEVIVMPMINEAARILDEKIAARAADIDLVQIHGYGFPRWRGGLMYYGDTLGLQNVVDKVLRLNAQGLAPPPSPYLVLAAQHGGFSALEQSGG